MVFLAILVPINFWSVVIFFRELPSYILRMTFWNILAVYSYTQFIALLDSLLLLFLLLFTALVFPPSFRKDHFVPIASMIGYLAILWTIPFHYLDALAEWLPLFLQPWTAWLWILLFVLVSVAIIYFVRSSARLRDLTMTFIDRISPLAWIYLTSNLLSILVIVGRNLGLR